MFSFLREHADRVMHIVSLFVETIHDTEGIKQELEHLGKGHLITNYEEDRQTKYSHLLTKLTNLSSEVKVE